MGIDSLHGETHTMLSETLVTASSFSDFVLSLPFPPRTVLLMDNAAIHKTACVRRAAEQKEYELVFTPPYSPEVNPIEMVFGLIKRSFHVLRYRHPLHNVSDSVASALQHTPLQMSS